VILAGGALGTPHLLLASQLERHNPGGAVVGRYLTRHCNAIVFGVFPRVPDPERRFHKQLAIHDFYFGAANAADLGKLGGIQQLQTPPAALVEEHVPRAVRAVLGGMIGSVVEHLTGLLVMAEDEPQLSNGVSVNFEKRDDFGLPELQITHRYTARDQAACRALVGQARRVLKGAGAWLTYLHNIRTFSHASGTVRAGKDPRSSALDEHCRFRGIENLYVADASFMPSSGGVNPSLTIAANALRIGRHLVEEQRARSAA
jgi:choline dehydrogenase-like flavoprotein